MPQVWENSYVDKLGTLNPQNPKVVDAVAKIRRAIEPLILPDAAKLLIAITTDVMTAIQTRNDRTDVNDACAALRTAIAMIAAVDPDLQG
jgi:hypothetical protein